MSMGKARPNTNISKETLKIKPPNPIYFLMKDNDIDFTFSFLTEIVRTLIHGLQVLRSVNDWKE